MRYLRNGFVLSVIFSFPIFVYGFQTNQTANKNIKSDETSEIIVAVIGRRVRSEPNVTGKI